MKKFKSIIALGLALILIASSSALSVSAASWSITKNPGISKTVAVQLTTSKSNHGGVISNCSSYSAGPITVSGTTIYSYSHAAKNSTHSSNFRTALPANVTFTINFSGNTNNAVIGSGTVNIYG